MLTDYNSLTKILESLMNDIEEGIDFYYGN